MKRRSWRWLALLSISILTLGSAVVFRFRSGWTSDEITWQRAGPSTRWDWVIASRDKVIYLGALTDSERSNSTSSFNIVSDRSYSVGLFCWATMIRWGRSEAGFGVCFDQIWPQQPAMWHRVRLVAVPHTALILMAGIGVGLSSWKLVNGRRYWTGRCPTCGYDLRATPNRCPECGATPRSEAR